MWKPWPFTLSKYYLTSLDPFFPTLGESPFGGKIKVLKEEWYAAIIDYKTGVIL